MKIVISGYYGFGNAGDEAILEAMLRDLRTLRPDVQPVVLSGNPAVTAARFGVEAVPRLDVRAIVRALRGADLFISGGGSLLQDSTGWGSVPYYAGLMWLARRLGVPVFVYAQGVGPLRRPLLRALAGRLMRSASVVTVRDRLSFATLRQLGVGEDQMNVTADPVFGLTAGQDIGLTAGHVLGLTADSVFGSGPRSEPDAGDAASHSGVADAMLPSDVVDAMLPSGVVDAMLPSGVVDAMLPSGVVDAMLPSGVVDAMLQSDGGDAVQKRRRPVIGISLRPRPGGDGGGADTALAAAVAAALGPRLNKWDADVVLLPLHGAEDVPLAENLREKLAEVGVGDRVFSWAEYDDALRGIAPHETAPGTAGYSPAHSTDHSPSHSAARSASSVAAVEAAAAEAAVSDAAVADVAAGDGAVAEAAAASEGTTAEALAGTRWIERFSRLDLCVTMRLHGLIFAACGGTPFVALSDDPKLAAHVDELGLDRSLCLVSPTAPLAPTLSDALDQVWEERTAIRTTLKEVVPKLAERARRTAIQAIELVESLP